MLRPVFAIGDWVDEVLANPIPLGTGITGWVVANRRTRNVPNVCTEPLSNIVAGTLDEPEAFVCVPLLAPERVLGALNVYRNGEDVAFTDEEVELVERFATMAALAYDSARQRETLREQVRRDGLTGLLNHRACHERLREALAGGGQVAVVLLDLDHFKVINDAHGHAEGDRVLAATAERLRSVVRSGDTVGRLGGEEFVLILPGADVEAAEDCAERARAALAELTVRGPTAGRVGRCRRGAGRRRRGRRTARERRRRAVLGQAHGARPDRALRARRRAARGRAAQRDRGDARAGHRRGPIVFQPVVELATGRAGGFEALARIEREPRRGPDEWFAQAHRVGLGEELEALALRAALAVPGRPEGTFLAVNVSPRALLSAPVRAALPEDLTGIVIELTEHEVFGAEGELEAELAALRARGAQVALDDAGAGYAGLQQIIRIAPDILKLDRALVHGAHADPLAPGAAGGADRVRVHAPARRSAPRASRTSRTCARSSRSTSPTRRATGSPARRRGWPSPAPEATRAGAARIQRACASRAPRAAAPRHSRAGSRTSPTISRRRPRSRPRRRQRPRGQAARRRRCRTDARRPHGRRARPAVRTTTPTTSARAGRSTTSRPPATCSTTASRARSSWATRPATPPSSPSSPISASAPS